MTKQHKTMIFTKRLICELPFVLNLSKQEISVKIKDRNLTLFVSNGFYAATKGVLGESNSIQIFNSEQIDNYNKQGYSICKLRTVIMCYSSIENSSLIDEYNETDVKRYMKFKNINCREHIMKEDIILIKKNNTARSLFDKKMDYDVFIDAINLLIKHYMSITEDYFVEEVSIHQLSSSLLMGIIQNYLCDYEDIGSINYIGKIPPIMKKPWIKYEDSKISKLVSSLQNGECCEELNLLKMRAKNLLEKGACRSAIVEISAYLEASIAQRIRIKLQEQGETEEYIDNTLSQTKGRFDDRAKKQFNTIVGFSLADVDQQLWCDVKKYRDKYRNYCAHGSYEPSRTETQDMITLFSKLAEIALYHLPNPSAATSS